MKIFQIIILSFTMLVAYPSEAFNTFFASRSNTSDMRVLESLDIQKDFLTNSAFIKLKNTLNRKDFKEKLLKRYSNGYMFASFIKDKLSDASVPDEFLYLAMAESGFSPRAYSVKRASGLWQFTYGTAKLYGLRINTYVDERRDIVRSTEIAFKYLNHLHDKFGKWYLAAMAYNCGPGRLSRAIRRAHSDKLSVLLNAKKGYVPRETRNYIRTIITLAMLFSNKDALIKEGYSNILNSGDAANIEMVKIGGGVYLGNVARDIGMSLKELKRLNMHFRYDITPANNKDYNLYIPDYKVSDFEENYVPRKENVFILHVVKRGDSLYSIARRYGVEVRAIKSFNSLHKNILHIKQVVRVPKPQRKYKIS